MQLAFSTNDVPERDVFAYWADGVQANTGTRRLPMAGAAGPFRARSLLRRRGPIVHAKSETDPHIITRGPAELAQMGQETYWLYREASAGSWCNYGGRESLAKTGDLILADFNMPFEAKAPSGFRYESWLLPKSLIDPHLPGSARIPRQRTLNRDGAGALAASYLDTLTREWDSIPERSMAQVADCLARLLGIANGTAAGEYPEEVRTARLEDAKRYINQHLASPDLTPALVAATLRISVRTLHLLFEPVGTSFARYVLIRRLEECRMALVSNPARPVIDIAFAWGFKSLASFYRTFQAAFSLSPGDLRASERDRPC